MSHLNISTRKTIEKAKSITYVSRHFFVLLLKAKYSKLPQSREGYCLTLIVCNSATVKTAKAPYLLMYSDSDIFLCYFWRPNIRRLLIVCNSATVLKLSSFFKGNSENYLCNKRRLNFKGKKKDVVFVSKCFKFQTFGR